MKSFVKRGAAFLLAASLAVMMGLTAGAAEETTYLDNSSLLPAYVPDDQVTLLDNGSPEWMRSLIMTQFRIETATPEGTFQSAVRVLDHYAEMGVNGLWINPIYENVGYCNWGPDTVEPDLTGKTTLEESYAVIKDFVNEAFLIRKSVPWHAVSVKI